MDEESYIFNNLQLINRKEKIFAIPNKVIEIIVDTVK